MFKFLKKQRELSSQEKGFVAANRILESSTYVVEKLSKLEGQNNVTEKMKWEVFQEYLMFLLHWCDRVYWGGFKNLQEKNAFMDSLFSHLIYKCYDSKKINIAIEEFKQKFISLCADRQHEYASYKLFAGKNEGLGGTICWEFSKKISIIIRKNPDDISIIMATSAYVNSCLEYLRLQDLI